MRHNGQDVEFDVRIAVVFLGVPTALWTRSA